jgi:hypothetical protein
MPVEVESAHAVASQGADGASSPEKPSPEDFRQRTKKLIRQGIQSGIPANLFPFCEDDVRMAANVAASFCGGKPLGSGTNLIEKIFESDDWTRRGTLLVVSGGSPENRLRLGCACLWAALVGNADCHGQIGRFLPMTDLLIYLNSFAPERMELVADLKQMPCLMLYDLNESAVPSDRTDAPLLLENLIAHRVLYDLPVTILTFHDGLASRRADENLPLFGPTLSRIIARQGKLHESKIWNWRAHD